MRLCFHKTGNPLEVLNLEARELPLPGPDEVAVEMAFSPVHPADINFIEGVYGKKPVFPATPGNEACGRVACVGKNVRSLAPGDFVIALRPGGFWSDHLIMEESAWLKVDDRLDAKQAAMLRINPATAWHLLHDFRKISAGGYVVQNAANSAVGRSVIQIARHLGWSTINFVRRQQLAPELTALGANHVLPDDADGLSEALSLTAANPPVLAFNAIGGDSALRLMELLAPGGTHVTYGAMSRRSLKIPNRLLIFKDLEIRGCWISRKFEAAGRTEITAMLGKLADLMLAGKLQLPVDSCFALDDWRHAINRAQEQGRSGKVLLSGCGAY